MAHARRLPASLALALTGLSAACRPAAVLESQSATGHSLAAEPSRSPWAPGGPTSGPGPADDVPVVPGASPAATDAGAIAAWTSGDPGPDVYAYYLSALPAAGFEIIESAPGGAVAVLRFLDAGGAAFRLELTVAGGLTRIELRPDQPP
jgi:hypothetical protein